MRLSQPVVCLFLAGCANKGVLGPPLENLATWRYWLGAACVVVLACHFRRLWLRAVIAKRSNKLDEGEIRSIGIKAGEALGPALITIAFQGLKPAEWGFRLVRWVLGWGGLGAIFTVAIGICAGLQPGPMVSVALFYSWFWPDERLLTHLALPAAITGVAFHLFRWVAAEIFHAVHRKAVIKKGLSNSSPPQ